MTLLSLSRPRIAARVMRGLFIGLLCLVGGERTIAQERATARTLTHALRAQGGSGIDVLQRPAAQFYDVVALRVEFQPDSSRFTTGDGTFSDDLYRGLEVSIDPLPHDAGYFQAHLDFLSHYVEHVSDGRTVVSTHLVPEIIRVSQPMAAYSPVGENSDSDAELGKLAALIREAWALASQQSTFDLSGFNPVTTALVLFHAGAGRDIELTGTSLDRTPQDLPSLFFDASALQRLSPGAPITFNGFPVQSTLVMPETESRLGRDFIADEDFVAEFSINGFLAASFFSFLGVPDLFNAETGESAIGPFGLMDPLGIFAFNGLFPPEPSAWTKQYLGWNIPVEISPATDPQEATLGAVSALGFSDAVRVPISGAEYFLVENRQRAAESDDLVLSIYRDGQIVEQRIPLGAEGFDRFNVSAFEGGVVVAAEPYDRALPGVADQGERFDGGILIWHIDERVLRDGLASNRVNADPDRRGVDVEEADSGQDLGFGNGGVALGTPFDFWYEGNPATAITATGQQIQLYENRFGPDTFPSSDASEGGPSFVELSDFSASGALMSFLVGIGNSDLGISPRSALWREASVGSSTSSLRVHDHLVQMNDENGGLLVVQGTADPDDSSLLRVFDSQSGDELLTLPGGSGLVVTEDGYLARLTDEEGRARLDLINRTGVAESYTYNFVLPQLLPSELGPSLIAVGQQFYALGLTPQGQRAVRLDRALDSWVEVDVGLANDTRAISFVPGIGLVASDDLQVRSADGAVWTTGGDPGSFAMGTEGGELVGAVLDRAENAITWLLPEGVIRRLWQDGTGTLGAQLSLSDLDDDGFLDVIAFAGNMLVAYSQSGAVVAGFPILIPGMANNAPTRVQPLIAEMTADGELGVIVEARGSLHAFLPARSGAPTQGFPLPVGIRMAATPLLADGALFALSEDGLLRVWDLGNLGVLPWGQRHANPMSMGSIQIDGTPGTTLATLLDETETYNWPNPVRDGRTFLRFRTSEDADVSILIVDLAGSFVAELDAGAVRGGIPTEVEWTTNAPSGVYFARVTARTASGREDSRLIRMAVIR